MVKFQIEDHAGNIRNIEVPEEINLSLMEVLKASEYEIAATCGGMALCATCRVEVTSSTAMPAGPTDAELDMIDTLPDATQNSRLACQIKISPALEGARFKLKGSPEN